MFFCGCRGFRDLIRCLIMVCWIKEDVIVICNGLIDVVELVFWEKGVFWVLLSDIV